MNNHHDYFSTATKDYMHTFTVCIVDFPCLCLKGKSSKHIFLLKVLKRRHFVYNATYHFVYNAVYNATVFA
jgi:hypothetical protein